MRKILLCSLLFLISIISALAHDVAPYYTKSSYYEDNYDEYILNYHPEYRPYAIAGNGIARLYVRSENGRTIAIPEKFPKSDYENEIEPSHNSDSYIAAPFPRRQSSPFVVQYVNLHKNTPITFIEVHIL
ncbi:MAG: hypothetical protein ABIJ34_05140 [archaeon]